jgi:hypothetical protein
LRAGRSSGGGCACRRAAARRGWAGAFALFDFHWTARFHLVPEVMLLEVPVGQVPVHGFGVRLGAGARWDL